MRKSFDSLLAIKVLDDLLIPLNKLLQLEQKVIVLLFQGKLVPFKGLLFNLQFSICSREGVVISNGVDISCSEV